MAKFEFGSKTIPEMVYNLKTQGGAKLKGSAEVEVVHKGKNQEVVDNQTQFDDDMLVYLEYALNRVENS